MGIQAVKNWFKKSKEVKSQKYYLIFMDMSPAVQFIERQTLTEIYNIIVDARLVVGTYKIIKGEFLNE